MVRLAALTAVVLSTLCGQTLTLELPVDNLRTRYREDAALFNTRWAPPVLLTGKVATRQVPTDTILHSEDDSRSTTWLDYVYPFSWEKEFEGATLCSQCRGWWWMSYVAALLYLIGLWSGTSWMKDKTAYNLHVPLALWNLVLAVFSFIGALRTAPHLLMVLHNYGFDYTVCRAALASYGSGATGLWVALFIFSKYAELIDTVFLVVRKRKVGFLHWYHHCSVLLYCWHAYVWEMPTGIYFVTMNYSVHAIMYFYYFLAAVSARPPKWALLVTILQLVQMAIGISITLLHLHMLIYRTVANCDGHIPNLAAALCMYASYFVLFAQFLFQRYCTKRSTRSTEAKPGKKPSKLE